MRLLSEFPVSDRAAVRFVLTDIDDTLTLGGRLPAVAYEALERLQKAGKIVIPVTGRPAGWCDLIARLWPVDAVVGENGALYFRYDSTRGMIRAYNKADAERSSDRARLEALGRDILKAVPGARIAADQRYRESDLAIDVAEDVPRLPKGDIDSIVHHLTAAGATAKISSIHVNGWYGDYDKLAMTRRLLREAFAVDIDEQNETIIFVGDSPNDEPMFSCFRNSVAVANFRDFAGQVRHKPRWVTPSDGSRGFAEVADVLLVAGV